MTHSMSLDDGALVTLAANYLEVSEFEIFRASYQSWYSDEGPDALIERHFGDYLRHGDVPFWVRHFSRESLSEERRDEPIRLDMAAHLRLALRLYGSFRIAKSSRAGAPSLAA